QPVPATGASTLRRCWCRGQSWRWVGSSGGGRTRRQVNLDAAQLGEAVDERGEQPLRGVVVADSGGQDCAHLGLHGPTVPGCTDAQLLAHGVIEIPDADGSHHHLQMLAMLAFACPCSPPPTDTG